MPKTIHPSRAHAPGPPDIETELHELRQMVHSLAQSIQAQARRELAAPQTSESVVLQLLLDERRRADERDQELRQLQNPLHQLDQLQALADLVQPAKEDNSLLQGALEALGGVISASMDTSEPSPSSGAPPSPDAGDGGELP